MWIFIGWIHEYSRIKSMSIEIELFRIIILML